jgi:hypothetical protein
VPGGIPESPCQRGSQIQRPGPPRKSTVVRKYKQVKKKTEGRLRLLKGCHIEEEEDDDDDDDVD